MFIPVKMTVQLEDGRIVEFDFNNTDCLVVSSESLTAEEKATLGFKAGLFCGGGNKALSQFGD